MFRWKLAIMFVALTACGVSPPDIDGDRLSYATCLGEELGNSDYINSPQGREHVASSPRIEDKYQITVMLTNQSAETSILERLDLLLDRTPILQRSAVRKTFQSARETSASAKRSFGLAPINISTITDRECYEIWDKLAVAGAYESWWHDEQTN